MRSCGASCQLGGMLEQRVHRLVAAPIALLAALAIATGGGSAPLATGVPAARTAPRPAAIHLDHIELVALRAQSTRGEITR